MHRASALYIAALVLAPRLAAAATWSEEAVLTPPTAGLPLFATSVDLGTSILVTESLNGTLQVYTRSEGTWSGPDPLTFPIDELSDGFARSDDDLITLLEIGENGSDLFTSFKSGGAWSPPAMSVYLGGVAEGESHSLFAAADTRLYVTTKYYTDTCEYAPALRAFRREDNLWIADGEVHLATCPAGPRQVTAVAADGDRVAFILSPSGAGADTSEPAAYVYRKGGDTGWFEEGSFTVDDALVASDYTALALDGDWIALGAAAVADGHGVVDLYEFGGEAWALAQRLVGPEEFSFAGKALALDGGLLATKATRAGERVVELYSDNGEWLLEATIKGEALALDLKGPRVAVSVSSPRAIHIFKRDGELPDGVCVDDGDCAGRCLDGVCVPPGEADDDQGCGCRSDGGPASLGALALLALALTGKRRRRWRCREARPTERRRSAGASSLSTRRGRSWTTTSSARDHHTQAPSL